MSDLENALPSLINKDYNGYVVSQAYPFIYNDPVDNTSTKNGLIIHFTNGSRIVYRLSGTGTSGATLRVYIERYVTDALLEDPEAMLEDLSNISRQIAEIPARIGKNIPDIIT